MSEMPKQAITVKKVGETSASCLPKYSNWEMKTEFRVKKTGAKEPSLKVRGTGRLFVEAELEI